MISKSVCIRSLILAHKYPFVHTESCVTICHLQANIPFEKRVLEIFSLNSQRERSPVFVQFLDEHRFYLSTLDLYLGNVLTYKNIIFPCLILSRIKSAHEKKRQAPESKHDHTNKKKISIFLKMDLIYPLQTDTRRWIS